MPRIKTSNCISRLLWFGSDEVGILPILIGMKEAKVAALQLSIAIGTGWGGISNEFKRDNEIRIQAKLFVG